MPNLKLLDISYNSLTNSDVSGLLDAIINLSDSKLRSLNISGNHAYHTDSRLAAGNQPEKLSDKI